MAENSKLTGIELNGVLYSLGKSIYEELDISLVRFAELLGRDFYCPTLSSAPTSSTLSYADTDGETHTFQIGQPCRWAEGENWRLALCEDMTPDGSVWYVLPSEFVTVEDLNNKQDKALKYTDVDASVWVADSAFPEFGFRCDIPCSGVTDAMFASVAFANEQAMSGAYSPLCETRTNVVSIWSTQNVSITIPSIIIHK
jgi:hypothetical protein